MLPQINSTNIDVNVQPFWGDTEQCQVGITRLDWNVEGVVFTPSAIFYWWYYLFMVMVLTMGQVCVW